MLTKRREGLYKFFMEEKKAFLCLLKEERAHIYDYRQEERACMLLKFGHIHTCPEEKESSNLPHRNICGRSAENSQANICLYIRSLQICMAFPRCIEKSIHQFHYKG